MKHISVIILIALASCAPKASTQEPQDIKEISVHRIGGDYNSSMKVLLIDSCEYIATTVYMGQTLVHKGNCKNH